MATRIQLRRGTAAEWTAVNPVLAQGEPGVEMDTGKSKIGNGVDAWADLDYSSADIGDVTPTGIGAVRAVSVPIGITLDPTAIPDDGETLLVADPDALPVLGYVTGEDEEPVEPLPPGTLYFQIDGSSILRTLLYTDLPGSPHLLAAPEPPPVEHPLFLTFDGSTIPDELAVIDGSGTSVTGGKLRMEAGPFEFQDVQTVDTYDLTGRRVFVECEIVTPGPSSGGVDGRLRISDPADPDKWHQIVPFGGGDTLQLASNAEAILSIDYDATDHAYVGMWWTGAGNIHYGVCARNADPLDDANWTSLANVTPEFDLSDIGIGLQLWPDDDARVLDWDNLAVVDL